MNHRGVRIKDGELRHEFFHLVARFVQGEQGIRADFCACHCRHKLDQRLVGNSGGVISESPMQNITRDSLLLRITGIKTVDKHICINEEGHDRKGPLLSNRGLRVGLRARASCGMQRFAFPGGPSPAQKVGAVAGAWQRSLCGMRTATVLRPVSSPLPLTSPVRLRGESCTAQQSPLEPSAEVYSSL